ncbi:Hypothetical_protein [Hexamita inflata]|uniref:Hypothetical_protein n=1 Tax=Hexamita inflata TaxID=28002 RepID=A0AA86Q5R5_9EUKA|nr:Hypothetical protein HINF_LOCUS40534 [Hexamita inflata]
MCIYYVYSYIFDVKNGRLYLQVLFCCICQKFQQIYVYYTKTPQNIRKICSKLQVSDTKQYIQGLEQENPHCFCGLVRVQTRKYPAKKHLSQKSLNIVDKVKIKSFLFV